MRERVRITNCCWYWQCLPIESNQIKSNRIEANSLSCTELEARSSQQWIESGRHTHAHNSVVRLNLVPDHWTLDLYWNQWCSKKKRGGRMNGRQWCRIPQIMDWTYHHTNSIGILPNHFLMLLQMQRDYNFPYIHRYTKIHSWGRHCMVTNWNIITR